MEEIHQRNNTNWHFLIIHNDKQTQLTCCEHIKDILKIIILTTTQSMWHFLILFNESYHQLILMQEWNTKVVQTSQYP